MIQSALLAAYLVFWGAMGLTPLDSQNWVLSSILPLTFVGALVFGRRSLLLSTTSYALISTFLTLHTIGAHYTYAQVPLGHWLQSALALERNHFDRIVHFAFGLLLTYPLFEAFHRFTGARRPLLFYLAFMTQLGLAGAWEIIESVVAQLTRPDLGAAFLGAQGDPWDAQHDMLAAICGTVVALVVVAAWQRMSEGAPHRDPRLVAEAAPRQPVERSAPEGLA
jgi:putative membrane protein